MRYLYSTLIIRKPLKMYLVNTQWNITKSEVHTSDQLLSSRRLLTNQKWCHVSPSITQTNSLSCGHQTKKHNYGPQVCLLHIHNAALSYTQIQMLEAVSTSHSHCPSQDRQAHSHITNYIYTNTRSIWTLVCYLLRRGWRDELRETD